MLSDYNKQIQSQIQHTDPRTSLHNDIVVSVDCLSKCYRIYAHPRDRLIQGLWGRDARGRRKEYFSEFWALQPISFNLRRGQTLGIVGRNGSGKSTLLQLICGTVTPTGGSVEVCGRIGALLELGSGFNPEFNGLENIFLNAALLGLKTSEINERLDDILAFADIGSFINQPVKTYSSGMAVRLAFAVQAHINPDLMVVDEALAVGDELFQKKCYAHLERLKENGTAVLLVTHSCPQIIQHCDEAILLHRGRSRLMGDPTRVTVLYQRLINATDDEWDRVCAAVPITANSVVSTATSSQNVALSAERLQGDATPNLDTPWFDPALEPQSKEIYPTHGASITSMWIEDESGNKVNTIPFGMAFNIIACYKSDVDLDQLACTCLIASHTGQRVTGHSCPVDARMSADSLLNTQHTGKSWQITFPFQGGLWPGTYFIGGAIVRFGHEGQEFIHRVVDYIALRISDSQTRVLGACCLQRQDAIIHKND